MDRASKQRPIVSGNPDTDGRNGVDFRFDLDLSAPVDIYYDWVDACDAVMKDNPDSNNPLSASRAPDRAGPAASRPSAGVTAGDNEEGNLDDFIEDDEMDAEADFAEV